MNIPISSGHAKAKGRCFIIKYQHRSPWVAMLWSMTIPGFGQLYNKDYVIALILLAFEFLVNANSHLNLVIIHSFRGQFQSAAQIVDYQWLMFYPCGYAFSMWQAFNRSLEINHSLQSSDPLNSPKPRHTGVFFGIATGGTLGVVFNSGIGPICCGLIGMAVGTVIGHVVEKRVSRNLQVIA